MNKDQFIYYWDRPHLLDESTLEGLKEMMQEFSYFAQVRMLYLRNLKNINSYLFSEELLKHAIFIPDRKVLYKLLDIDISNQREIELLPFDKDAFKNFFNSENTHEDAPFEFISAQEFNLTDGVSEKEDIFTSGSDDLIDRFLTENPTIANDDSDKVVSEALKNEEKTELVESLITETLARIYISQKLYPEAINAYEKLILKFPEKNGYFATQIEKIKTLIKES